MRVGFDRRPYSDGLASGHARAAAHPHPGAMPVQLAAGTARAGPFDPSSRGASAGFAPPSSSLDGTFAGHHRRGVVEPRRRTVCCRKHQPPLRLAKSGVPRNMPQYGHP